MSGAVAPPAPRRAAEGGARAAHVARDAAALRPLVLSSSLLTERMLLHSSFADGVAEAGAAVQLWSSAADERTPSPRPGIAVEPFPAIGPFPYLPHNFLRRVNDQVWDAHLRLPCRESMNRHVRGEPDRVELRLAQPVARTIARAGLHRRFERLVRRTLVGYERSPEATARLRAARPDVVVSTGPHRFEEPAVVGCAQRLGIPTMALVTSWDNITTKNRIPFDHDAYLVWSAQMRRELHDCYPETRDRPTYVVGAPQFDAFHRGEYAMDRAEFCARQQLDPSRPIVLYALGSPNFLREHHGAVAFAERLERGELGPDAQLLVRPHPLFDNGAEVAAFAGFGPRVRVQRTGQAGLATYARRQGDADVVDWVNTFRHADVVVNLSSTATVDAAICGRPVVNLDYDPEPGAPQQALVQEINHAWPHFRPVAESGGVWLAPTMDDVVAGVRAYLVDPTLHADRRAWIVEHVAGTVDGRAGARLAAAIADFAARTRGGRA